MIEAPRHLIRASAGRVRVLRLVADGRAVWPLRYEAERGPGCCRQCGCTDRYACAGGCGWVNEERDLCSSCYERMVT